MAVGATVGLVPPCRGVLALLCRRRRARNLEGFGDLPRRGAAMSTHSVLPHPPLRAARWSATHPCRAIGAWFAFVAVAVALAALVPTQETKDSDYRLRGAGR